MGRAPLAVWSVHSRTISHLPCAGTAKELLLAKPHGMPSFAALASIPSYSLSLAAYTTLRTIGGGRRIVELEQHYVRLISSAQGLAGGPLSPPVVFDRSILRRLLRLSLPSCPVEEYRITVLFDPASATETLLALSEVIPPNPSSVQVEVRQMSRHEPGIKATRWVADRQVAERERQSSSSNEVILADAEGNLYEGLSSNFAVLERDSATHQWRLLTAPPGSVLAGSILQLVKEAASQQLGILVLEEPPRLDCLSTYQAAFITSTSRLLLPIHRILLPTGQSVLVGDDEEGRQAVKQLQAIILDMILSRSSELVERTVE